MKQFTYEAQDNYDLIGQLKELKRFLNSTEASSIIAHVFSGYTDRTRIEPVVQAIQMLVPEALVVGATAAGEIRAGKATPKTIVVSITVFETTKVSVQPFHIEAGQEEAIGLAVKDTIDQTPEIKAAELLVDSADISSATLFPVINACSARIEIFGAMPYAHNLSEPMFVFCDSSMADSTLVLVTYAGADFHVATDYVIGWKPMGVGMRVTKASGTLLSELDGQEALRVYDKYLQIPNDEHFYDNAFEFPFLRYANDVYTMRHPHAGLPDGSIELRAPVGVGDTMYLSYGDVPTIVSELLEARGRMERFHPQYIRMHNCAARKAFWAEEIGRETEPFQRLADTAGFFTGGEVLRVNGDLIHFNTTCVIVGMREGDPDPAQLLRTTEANLQEDINTQQTSMVRRMAHFINVAMQELLESNHQLDVLAKTDELTRLLNRREMGRIIAELHESKEPFCLLMADLDDFKNVNDTYGHDVGDIVLKDVAELIAKSIEDVPQAAAGRWGGEEFMVLLPQVSLERAHKVAEHLRREIEAFRFDMVNQLTISLGVADSKTYHDMKSIYHDVDRALYAAKAAGKNEVVLVTSLDDTRAS